MSVLGVVLFVFVMVLGCVFVLLCLLNVMIFNVLGLQGVLYWNGVCLDVFYLFLVFVDGVVLNIICSGINEQIIFGLMGCCCVVFVLSILIDQFVYEFELFVGVSEVGLGIRF